MHTNSFVPIPVSGTPSRGPRLDPNAPKRRRKGTQAHSNAARERVLANVPQNTEPVFSWQKRAAAKEAETLNAALADCTLISLEEADELRKMVNGE
jgi:hypothetical protein